MAIWICTNCRFRFNSERPKDCPYCGKTNTLEREKSATELLDEVEDMLNE